MAETSPVAPAPPGTAMQQAVAAEQDARRRIAEAEAQARADVEAVRAQARQLLNDVPARITRLRARGARAVEAAIRSIRAEEEAAGRKLRTAELSADVVERTVAEVARELTGADGPAGGRR